MALNLFHQKIVFVYYVTRSQRQNYYSIAICIINRDILYICECIYPQFTNLDVPQ